MALINCPECNKQISDKAPACPTCGHTKFKRPEFGCGTIILFIFILVITMGIFESTSSPKPAPVSAVKLSAAEEKLQTERKNFIDKHIEKGLFYKLETTGVLPHLYITPLFDTLDVDDKKSYLGAVFAYCITKNAKHDMIILNDSKTGKKLGSFSERGLSIE